MIKIKIHDLKSFENFLNVAGKFVQQGQLVIRKTESSLYCKNTKDFSTSRLLLDTNTITISEEEKFDIIKVCIRDISAFKSSISILQTVEQVNTAELELEIFPEDDEYFARSIQYNGKTKFKLISVDFQVIEQFVSKNLETEMDEEWSFYIDPARLDIIQNRTGSIVNVQDDVSVYLYGKTDNETNEKSVIIDLNAKKSAYINSIALPIADNYCGALPDDFTEVAIHDTSFRLLNILRVTDKKDLYCFFNSKFNIFFVESKIKTDDGFWIKSRLIIGIIKGK